MPNTIVFRKKLLNILLILSIIATIISITIFYFLNLTLAKIMLIQLIAYLLIWLVLYKNFFTYSIQSTLVVSAIFIQMLSLPILEGINSLVITWLVLFPIVSFSFKTSKDAIAINILFLIMLITLFSTSLLHQSYTAVHIAMITVIFTILSSLLFFVSHILLSQDLHLRELNKNLEKKVQDAVVDIHRRSELMMHQNRLAQMGEMVSMIAHQWRQPLTTISTIAAGLKVNILLDKYEIINFMHKLSEIEKHTIHLSETIDDFRDFFKPDKEKSVFTIQSPIDHALSLSHLLFEEKAIEIKQQGFVTKKIKSYENELTQVMMNLFKNAADAFEENGIENPYISITLNEEASNLLIAIEDNAGGIEKSLLLKIFDPYFSTKDSKNGTGLGLYMSKSIIEEHCGGKLSVTNKDEGACFVISLPLL